MSKFFFLLLSLIFSFETIATEIELLDLDIIPYEAFMQNEPTALHTLEQALLQKGIVGIRGVPGYKEQVMRFIETARDFSALPEDTKEFYAPNHALGETFLGYEKGKEKFKRPDGRWVVDDLKVSYYGFVPDSPLNKWPVEVDLKTPFQDLGNIMSEMGQLILQKIELVGTRTGLNTENAPRVGRMLYYKKSENSAIDNPYWCGSHYDHGLLTALLPAFYFVNGEAIEEPIEAGLFVKASSESVFKKVVANDPNVLLFQIGEFGQLATNDAVKATEHHVQKASGCIERYTMALFFDAPMDAVIHSYSELTSDSRYGGNAGDPCSYAHWHEESFKRYIVTEEN